MGLLTKDDKKIVAEYLDLVTDRREKYLEDIGIIITDIIHNDDNTHTWNIDISKKYSKMLKKIRIEEGLETLDETFTFILKEFIANASDKKTN
jgi:hypothetical protein